jgi:two-component system NarL family response regulator
MKLLLVDDHTLVRRGIAAVLQQRFPDAEVVEAEGTDDAIERLRDGSSDVDIALVDVRMPARDGLELLKEIKATWPSIRVIMLTSFDHARYVKAALADGADGYMLKDASPEDLDQAIRVAMAGGGNVLSARAMRALFEDEGAGGNEDGEPQRRHENLTKRELDILALLAEGRSNRDISRHLYLSEKTVKAHLAAVFRKLNVTNRTQAAMAAVTMGMGPGRALKVAE